MAFSVDPLLLRTSPLFIQGTTPRVKPIYYETADKSLLLSVEPKGGRAAPHKEDFLVLHFLAEIASPSEGWEGSMEATFSAQDYLQALALEDTPANCELLKRSLERMMLTSYELRYFHHDGKEVEGSVFSLVNGVHWHEGVNTTTFVVSLNSSLIDAGQEGDIFRNPFPQIANRSFRETLSPLAKAIIEYVALNTTGAGEYRVRLGELKKACKMYCGGATSVHRRIRYEELPFKYTLEAKNPRKPSLDDIACFIPIYDA